MPNQRILKRTKTWSSRVFISVGIFSIFLIAAARIRPFFEKSEKSRNRRDLSAFRDISDSIIHIKTGPIIDNSNKDEKNYFNSIKKERKYVKYQYPSEKFVPLDELGVIFLNGMKFYHQGSEMLPSNKSEVTVKKAQTRTSRIMECEGKADFKEYKRTHGRTTALSGSQLPAVTTVTTPMDTETTAGFDFSNWDALFEDDFQETMSERKRENAAQAAKDKDQKKNQKGNNEKSNDVSDSEEIEKTGAFDESAARSVVDKDLADFFASYFNDEKTTLASAKPTTAATTTSTTTDAVVVPNHHIGCCNGVPYNRNKRCCCRRQAFDKEKKFCCAINGCENFRIFDRSDPKNVDLCLSLEGLVVQEYGYTGKHVALGEPDLTKTPRARG